MSLEVCQNVDLVLRFNLKDLFFVMCARGHQDEDPNCKACSDTEVLDPSERLQLYAEPLFMVSATYIADHFKVGEGRIGEGRFQLERLRKDHCYIIIPGIRYTGYADDTTIEARPIQWTLDATRDLENAAAVLHLKPNIELRSYTYSF